MARWGMREQYIASSPFDYSREGNIDLYNEAEADRDVYTESEFLALIAAAEAENNVLIRDMIVVFGLTGMRYQELTHLTPQCIDWTVPIPLIRISTHDGWTPKDPREKKNIPMLPDVQKVIKQRCQQCQSGTDLLQK
jgi:integrase